MRLGPRKVVGLFVLAVWIAVCVWLAMGDQTDALLVVAAVTPAVVLLSALHHLKQVERTHQLVAGVADKVRDSARRTDDAVSGVREDVQGLQAQISREHSTSRREARSVSEEVQRSSSTILAAVEQGLTRPGQGRGPAKSDIEWLEDMLAGQASSLQQIAAGQKRLLKGEPHSRSLRPRPGLGQLTHSTRRINELLADIPDSRYLEIGLDRGHTFEDVAAHERWGVDPHPRFSMLDLPSNVRLFVTTSDDFFELLDPAVVFDVVFIDGLHVYRQVYRDLLNAFSHAGPSGTALVDDVVPVDAISAIPDLDRSISERRRRGLKGTPWHGDVFRVVPILRDHHPGLEYRTIVGSGREQLVVWRGDLEVPLAPIPESALVAYEDLAYDDVFRDGIPPHFQPRDEGEAIAEARASTMR